jgi:hypothetical protein
MNKQRKARLEQRLMRLEDVEPCPVCRKPADPAIKGYDGAWRCVICHVAHCDMVNMESGDTAPNLSEETKPLTVTGRTLEEKRAAVHTLRGSESEWPKKNYHETEDARRERILEKFGVKS